MIQTDLPDGPASPLVRGLAACLSSVLEVPLAELPEPDDLAVQQALASWKSWLAGRGFGMVPIADPRSFQWAGWWIAVVDDSDSPFADGPQHQVGILAFGTPPGVVLSPQDPTLLGQATADLPISSAHAVASLNPVLSATAEASLLTGVVELLAIAPLVEAPMQLGRVPQWGWGWVAEPDHDAGHGEGAPVDVVTFVVAGGHGAVAAELVDGSFDGVAVSVADLVESGWSATAGALALAGGELVVFDRDDGGDLAFGQMGTDRLGGVGLVGQDRVGPCPGPAGPGPGHLDLGQGQLESNRVVSLPDRGDEPQGTTPTVGGEVDLGGQAAA